MSKPISQEDNSLMQNFVACAEMAYQAQPEQERRENSNSTADQALGRCRDLFNSEASKEDSGFKGKFDATALLGQLRRFAQRANCSWDKNPDPDALSPVATSTVHASGNSPEKCSWQQGGRDHPEKEVVLEGAGIGGFRPLMTYLRQAPEDYNKLNIKEMSFDDRRELSLQYATNHRFYPLLVSAESGKPRTVGLQYVNTENEKQEGYASLEGYHVAHGMRPPTLEELKKWIEGNPYIQLHGADPKDGFTKELRFSYKILPQDIRWMQLEDGYAMPFVDIFYPRRIITMEYCNTDNPEASIEGCVTFPATYDWTTHSYYKQAVKNFVSGPWKPNEEDLNYLSFAYRPGGPVNQGSDGEKLILVNISESQAQDVVDLGRAAAYLYKLDPTQQPADVQQALVNFEKLQQNGFIDENQDGAHETAQQKQTFDVIHRLLKGKGIDWNREDTLPLVKTYAYFGNNKTDADRQKLADILEEAHANRKTGILPFFYRYDMAMGIGIGFLTAFMFWATHHLPSVIRRIPLLPRIPVLRYFPRRAAEVMEEIEADTHRRHQGYARTNAINAAQMEGEAEVARQVAAARALRANNNAAAQEIGAGNAAVAAGQAEAEAQNPALAAARGQADVAQRVAAAQALQANDGAAATVIGEADGTVQAAASRRQAQAEALDAELAVAKAKAQHLLDKALRGEQLNDDDSERLRALQEVQYENHKKKLELEIKPNYDWGKALNGEDLTEKAINHEYDKLVPDPVVQSLLDTTLTRNFDDNGNHIPSKTDPNSVILVRDSGGGKTAEAEAHTARVANGLVPKLKGWRTMLFRAASLEAWKTGVAGGFETASVGLIEWCIANKVIPLLDQLEGLANAGKHAQNDMPGYVLWLTYLGRGRLPVIATITGADLEKYFVGSLATQFLRRFVIDRSPPPEGQRLIDILQTRVVEPAEKAGIKITPKAIETAIERSGAIYAYSQPAAAIDLINAAIDFIKNQMKRASEGKLEPGETDYKGEITEDLILKIAEKEKEQMALSHKASIEKSLKLLEEKGKTFGEYNPELLKPQPGESEFDHALRMFTLKVRLQILTGLTKEETFKQEFHELRQVHSHMEEVKELLNGRMPAHLMGGNRPPASDGASLEANLIVFRHRIQDSIERLGKKGVTVTLDPAFMDESQKPTPHRELALKWAAQELHDSWLAVERHGANPEEIQRQLAARLGVHALDAEAIIQLAYNEQELDARRVFLDALTIRDPESGLRMGLSMAEDQPVVEPVLLEALKLQRTELEAQLRAGAIEGLAKMGALYQLQQINTILRNAGEWQPNPTGPRPVPSPQPAGQQTATPEAAVPLVGPVTDLAPDSSKRPETGAEFLLLTERDPLNTEDTKEILEEIDKRKESQEDVVKYLQGEIQKLRNGSNHLVTVEEVITLYLKDGLKGKVKGHTDSKVQDFVRNYIYFRAAIEINGATDVKMLLLDGEFQKDVIHLANVFYRTLNPLASNSVPKAFFEFLDTMNYPKEFFEGPLQGLRDIDSQSDLRDELLKRAAAKLPDGVARNGKELRDILIQDLKLTPSAVPLYCVTILHEAYENEQSGISDPARNPTSYPKAEHRLLERDAVLLTHMVAAQASLQAAPPVDQVELPEQPEPAEERSKIPDRATVERDLTGQGAGFKRNGHIHTGLLRLMDALDTEMDTSDLKAALEASYKKMNSTPSVDGLAWEKLIFILLYDDPLSEPWDKALQDFLKSKETGELLALQTKIREKKYPQLAAPQRAPSGTNTSPIATAEEASHFCLSFLIDPDADDDKKIDTSRLKEAVEASYKAVHGLVKADAWQRFIPIVLEIDNMTEEWGKVLEHFLAQPHGDDELRKLAEKIRKKFPVFSGLALRELARELQAMEEDKFREKHQEAIAGLIGLKTGEVLPAGFIPLLNVRWNEALSSVAGSQSVSERGYKIFLILCTRGGALHNDLRVALEAFVSKADGWENDISNPAQKEFFKRFVAGLRNLLNPPDPNDPQGSGGGGGGPVPPEQPPQTPTPTDTTPGGTPPTSVARAVELLPEGIKKLCGLDKQATVELLRAGKLAEYLADHLAIVTEIAAHKNPGDKQVEFYQVLGFELRVLKAHLSRHPAKADEITARYARAYVTGSTSEAPVASNATSLTGISANTFMRGWEKAEEKAQVERKAEQKKIAETAKEVIAKEKAKVIDLKDKVEELKKGVRGGKKAAVNHR